jgi:hypothetical protein
LLSLRGGKPMKSLKIALWVVAIGCLISVPFIVLPWSLIERIILWFGVDPMPNAPLAVYLFRVVCGVFGLIGIYFVILARNPLRYGPMLDLAAFGLILFGLLSLFVGVSLQMSPKVYIGDALSGLILGIAITLLSFKAKKTLSRSNTDR